MSTTSTERKDLRYASSVEYSDLTISSSELESESKKNSESFSKKERTTQLLKEIEKTKNEIDALDTKIKKKKNQIQANTKIVTRPPTKNKKSPTKSGQKRKGKNMKKSKAKLTQHHLTCINPRSDSCFYSGKVLPILLRTHLKSEKTSSVFEIFFLLNVYDRWKKFDPSLLLQYSNYRFLEKNKRQMEKRWNYAVRYTRLGASTFLVSCWDRANQKAHPALIKITCKQFELGLCKLDSEYAFTKTNCNNSNLSIEHSVLKLKWDCNNFAIYLENKSASNRIFFVDHRREESVVINCASQVDKHIIIYLFLLYNQSQGKHSLIGNNPEIQYIDPQSIDTFVQPPLLHPKRRIAQNLLSWKSFLIHNKIKSNKKLNNKNLFKIVYRSIRFYWDRNAINYLISVFVNREFPFLPGFIQLKKKNLTIGINHSAFKQFDFNSNFKIQFMKQDNKLLKIQGSVRNFEKFYSFKKKKIKLNANSKIEEIYISTQSKQDSVLLFFVISYFAESEILGKSGGEMDPVWENILKRFNYLCHFQDLNPNYNSKKRPRSSSSYNPNLPLNGSGGSQPNSKLDTNTDSDTCFESELDLEKEINKSQNGNKNKNGKKRKDGKKKRKNEEDEIKSESASQSEDSNLKAQTSDNLSVFSSEGDKESNEDSPHEKYSQDLTASSNNSNTSDKADENEERETIKIKIENAESESESESGPEPESEPESGAEQEKEQNKKFDIESENDFHDDFSSDENNMESNSNGSQSKWQNKSKKSHKNSNNSSSTSTLSSTIPSFDSKDDDQSISSENVSSNSEFVFSDSD
ncbi:retinitis pigmentosa gtpase regulator a-related [Anaeramoeba flamelloides]|uniref:Retinitis pigmentosa gtpase regulator a-related n=1 Tax=Anaeramoeba flamelloides TaxID=1746091 RepID=A0AAV7YFU4_9EUKA|nr:retinitis pigmentosa gtpase regulator a-related [Anaeramoeba flamelloides]